MAKAQEIVLIGAVIKSLQEAGSLCGETHIQKAIFVAKYVKDIPFESEFFLYKHGPFSFDLNTTLNNMRSQSIVFSSPLGFGSTYIVNVGLWSAFDRASGYLSRRYEGSISKVCAYLARKNVAELERVATAIYVRLNFPDLLTAADRNNKLMSLKPHISPAQAALAFEESLSLFPE